MKLLTYIDLKELKHFIHRLIFLHLSLLGEGDGGGGVFGDDSNKKFVHFLLLEIFLVIVNVNYCLFLEMKALSIQI